MRPKKNPDPIFAAIGPDAAFPRDRLSALLLLGQRGNWRRHGRKHKARRVSQHVVGPGFGTAVWDQPVFTTIEQDDQIVAALLGVFDDTRTDLTCQRHEVDVAFQLLGLLQIDRVVRVGLIRGRVRMRGMRAMVSCTLGSSVVRTAWNRSWPAEVPS